MQLTKRIQVLVTPDLQRRLQDRARNEGKSVGQLVREFSEDGLYRAPLPQRLRIVEELIGLNLPVGTVAEMKEQAVAGKLKW